MSISLREVKSREPTELPDGEEKVLLFEGAVVHNLRTSEEVELREAIDLDIYGTVPMTLRSRTTGEEITVQGISLLVMEEDGEKVHKPLNVVSKRLIEQLRPDLEDGSYLKQRYHITAVGIAPKRRFTVTREPL